MYVQIYLHIHRCVYSFVLHACLRNYMYIYVYIYTYIYTFDHIYTFMSISHFFNAQGQGYSPMHMRSPPLCGVVAE